MRPGRVSPRLHKTLPGRLTPADSPRLRAQHTATYITNEPLPPTPNYGRLPLNMSSDTADSDNDVRGRGQQAMLASQRAKQGRVAQMFPLGYKQGFSQWWSAPTAAEAENKVLSYIPYLQTPPTHTQTGSAPPSVNPSTTDIDTSSAAKASPVTTNSITDPYGPRTWRSQMVQLSGKNRALNEFSIERTDEPVADQNLVIVHGYGAGLGFFYKNFEGLSRPRGWHLYALDMLGMGRSSRPPFKIKAKTREKQIAEAEDWFVDSLEEWRVKKKIEKMTLVGHSMGGYMAVAYALKYPGRLNKLILASPVGIPEDPYAVKADMPSEEPETSTMANEFTQDQDETTQNGTATPRADNNNFLNARKKAEKEQQASNPNRLPADGNAPRKPLPRWLTYLWDANISPFSFVRWSGPLGPRLVSGWTSRRFSHLPQEEGLALHDYAYSLFKLRGSGEYALAYILAPGAFARSPLIRRIGGVGRQPLPSSQPSLSTNRELTESTAKAVENGIPVVLMYGENDWMDVTGGYAAKDKIDAAREKALEGKTAEEDKEDQGGAKVVIIKKAGHHVYLDNPDHFNEVMLSEMDDVVKRSKGLKKGPAKGVEIFGSSS